MKVRRILLGSLMLGTGFVYPASSAFACSCVPPPPDRAAVRQAQVVFSGVVADSVGAFLGGGQNAYAFEVDTVYKGEVHATQWIDTGSGGGDCGYEFRAGNRYVVFAHSEDGEHLYTSICTNTRAIGDGAQPPLEVAGTLIPERSRGTPPDLFLALLTLAVGLIAFGLGKKHRRPGAL